MIYVQIMVRYFSDRTRCFFMELCAAYLDVRNHKGRLYREILTYLFTYLLGWHIIPLFRGRTMGSFFQEMQVNKSTKIII